MELTLKKFSIILFLFLSACASEEAYMEHCKNIKTGVEFTYHSENVIHYSAGPFGTKPYNRVTDTEGLIHNINYETLPDYICKKI